MQNKFGLKDFVLYVLVVILGVTILLKLKSDGRQWERTQEVLGKVSSLESQISRIENKLDKGVMTVVERGGGGARETGATPGARDESWAREGIKIMWQPPVRPAHDPLENEKVVAGGEFTEIWEAQTKVLTPYISTDVYSRRVQELVLESMGALDPETLTIKGQLAEAWQVDPEGMWLRTRIRANARFSDGTPVTAEDARWSFHDYIMNEQIDSERSRSILRDSIAEVKVIDPRTVEYVFKERLFSNVDNALGLFVLNKSFYSRFSPSQINQSTGLLMGSGPFKLQGLTLDRQWAPPSDVVIERNEQYWGVKPALASIRYRAISEEIARLNSFAKGEAEMITPSAPQYVAKREDPAWVQRARFMEWVNMRSGYSFIAWNCDKRNGKPTPFSDRRVRLAMTHLLDREQMIRDIWKGVGVVAKGNMPLASPGANKSIEPWPYNPARGKELLKEAGWEDRNGNGVLEDVNGNEFQFEYSFSGGSEIAERIARFVKDAFGEAGIRVTLRSADWSVYQDFMKKRDFDAITLGWGANAPESDPRQIFHSESIKNEGDNFAQWNNEEADRLIDAGRREIDTDKRMLIWQELEAVLHREQPYTFIRVPPWVRFASPRIENIHAYPIGLMPQEFGRSTEMSPSPGM